MGLRVYGKWTVLVQTERYNDKWLCRCTCGNERLVVAKNLRNGHSTQCKQCAGLQNGGTARMRHGESHGKETPEYRAWTAMNERCYRVRMHAYPHYGGRGISVADEWRGVGGYERFLAHVGRRPASGYSIDRIDNDKNYEPGNVRWATRQQQMNNRRNNHLVTFKEETRTVADWSRITGVSAARIRQRLRKGWSIERTLTEPVTR